MPDRRDLPPLNALKAFEAAARHGGFVEASRELSVTPSAVSQQVKQLETWLGRTLFERLPRGLQLTDAGRSYLPSLSESLDRIESATRDVMRGDGSQILTISVPPSFAAQWLVSRLYRFQDAHPEIDIRLSATNRLVDLEREGIDLCVRHGLGLYPDVIKERLMGETIMPVCSPSLIQGPNPLRELADLKRHTLLHDEHVGLEVTWSSWLKAAGADTLGIDGTRGPLYSDFHLTVRAAIAGRGVIIGRTRLVEEEMESGLLVTPFSFGLLSPLSYWIIHLPGALEKPKVARFRDWLMQEAGMRDDAGNPTV